MNSSHPFRLLLLVVLVALLAACGETPTDPAVQTETPAAALSPESSPEEALAYWQAAAEANPDDAAAHYQLGLLFFLLDPRQAAEPLQQAEQLDSELAPQVSRLEAALRQIGAVDDPAYQSTIIGQALASLEEWQLAQIALEQAVQADPKYGEAWAYLGEVRQQTGSGDPLEALNEALRLNPNSYAGNLFASMYWKRNEQPERALSYLYTAIEQDVSNLSLQEDLAQTLVLAGKVEEGFQTIQDLLDQDPENPVIWRMLARLSIENGVQVSQVGLPAARQAVVLEPDSAEAALLLGRAYMLTNNTLLAERFFAQAAEQQPALAAPHFYLGMLYLNQEMLQPAQGQFRQALALAEASGEAAIAAQARQILGQYFP